MLFKFYNRLRHTANCVCLELSKSFLGVALLGISQWLLIYLDIHSSLEFGELTEVRV